jgi:hypothetical protein
MIEKDINLNDLKYYYDQRHGFVYWGMSPISTKRLEKMVNSLIIGKITEHLPEFFTRPNENSVIVVYPEGISFQSGKFYQVVNNLERIADFKIDILAAFLREQ